MSRPLSVTIALQHPDALIPRPVAEYAALWGTSSEQARRWAQLGKIPGAFKGPDGSWWVNPLQLIGWAPDETAEGSGQHPPVSGRVSGARQGGGHGRLRAKARNVQGS